MRKVIVAMLLFFVASIGPASEWMPYGSSPSEGGYKIYIDLATYRSSGDPMKMLVMYDYKTEQLQGRHHFLSKKIQHEHDCKEARMRTLFFSLHSGHMGSGNAVSSDDGIPANWIPVVPGSVDEALWKFACRKL